MNMKVNKFVNLLVIGLVLCVAASGCKKKPVGVTELPGAKTGKVGGVDSAPPIGATPPVSTEPFSTTPEHPSNPANLHDGWIKDAQALKSETVYFDYDSSVLKTGEKPKVSAVADYLKANSAKAVLVEGNCDERGTEEYNRSLDFTAARSKSK